MMEDATAKCRPYAVARSLVEPNGTEVLVRILNPTSEPITVYAGVLLGTLERVATPVGTRSGGPGEGVVREGVGGQGEGVAREGVGGQGDGVVREGVGGQGDGVVREGVGGQGDGVARGVGGMMGDGGAAVKVSAVKAINSEQKEVIQNLVQESGEALSNHEKELFGELLESYADVISWSPSDLGRTDKLQHWIHTGDACHIRQPVRRIPHHLREEVRKLLDDMLPLGFSSCVGQEKGWDNQILHRFQETERFLTQKDAYPLPRIDATLDTLHGSKWFTTLDLMSGYWQVEMHEADRPKTAFGTTEGLFQFRVMPFGLSNAPATFQRLMDLVLAKLQWSECLVYLDDVIVLGRSFEEHLTNLQSVLKQLRQAGLRLKLSKCSFFQHQVKYLGRNSLIGLFQPPSGRYNNSWALQAITGDSSGSSHILLDHFTASLSELLHSSGRMNVVMHFRPFVRVCAPLRSWPTQISHARSSWIQMQVTRGLELSCHRPAVMETNE